MFQSEFSDEYGDWLEGGRPARRAGWLDLSLSELTACRGLCVSPNTPTEEVVKIMNARRESAVLVVEGERLLGIFTERDVLTRVLPRIDALFAPVCEHMTASPHTLPAETLLSCALRTLTQGKFHHLPVVDSKDRPVGLVSLQTILSFLVDTFPREILNAPVDRESFPPDLEGA